MKKTEIFPVVDLKGNVVGKATRAECHSGSMQLHPVVHMHIVDTEGRIFLQKRSPDKDIQPGRWDTAVGGHVQYGENIIDALQREIKEELGIEIENYYHLVTYDFTSSREHELINAYCTVVDSETFAPVIQKSEITEARFWTIAEIDEVRGKGVLTPNFESEFDAVKELIFQLL